MISSSPAWRSTALVATGIRAQTTRPPMTTFTSFGASSTLKRARPASASMTFRVPSSSVVSLVTLQKGCMDSLPAHVHSR
eukprot:1646379-Pyramimonas_sp.AAC.1